MSNQHDDQDPLSAQTADGAHRWSRVALIVNTKSRQGAAQFERAKTLLADAGIRLASAKGVKKPKNMRAEVQAAFEEKADLIIVGGGDGSIASTIDIVAHSACTFGLLPLGTANSFARALGIGVELERAVETLANGRPTAVDLVEVNGRMFVNSAAIGIPPAIGATIPPRLKRWLGRVGYLVWGAWTLSRFKPFRLTIDCDGERRRCWATEVRILNGPYTGGIVVDETAALDSGIIVLHLVTGKSRWRLAQDWYGRLVGRPGHVDDVIQLMVKQAEIDARPRQKVSLDGEVLARTPLKVRIHPSAVQVMVPVASE